MQMSLSDQTLRNQYSLSIQALPDFEPEMKTPVPATEEMRLLTESCGETKKIYDRREQQTYVNHYI
jgi:hypothetical protein